MKNLIIFLIVVSILSACGSEVATDKETTSETEKTTVLLSDSQFKNASIQTESIQKKLIASTIKVNGKIDLPPQNLISVSAPLGGYLKSTKLIAGMSVKKGTVLAVLEDQQYIQLQQDYLTSKAKLAYNEAEYKRQKGLNESKSTSDKVFEQAKANYETEYVLLKSLEEKLKLIGLNPQKISPNTISKSISLVSPIDGFVSAVNVNTGKYVNSSDVLFELVNTDEIHLTLTVFEKDIDKLIVGQKLIAYSNSDSSKKYECTILLINRSLSDQNATQIVCKFDQQTKDLLPGMFMNAIIDLSGSDVFALPDESIVRHGNNQYVFVERGDKWYEMKQVKIGNSENGFTAITDGESLRDEQIVVQGAYTLLMVLKNVSED